jgi:hypothetical protein
VKHKLPSSTLKRKAIVSKGERAGQYYVFTQKQAQNVPFYWEKSPPHFEDIQKEREKEGNCE